MMIFLVDQPPPSNSCTGRKPRFVVCAPVSTVRCTKPLRGGFPPIALLIGRVV